MRILTKVGLSIGIVAAALFVSCNGVLKDAISTASARPTPRYDPADFYKVRERIKRIHVNKDITDEQLMYGAIKGMIAALDDPHTAYIEPKEAVLVNDEEQGYFVGIGAELRKDPDADIILVTRPMPRHPAEAAGLRTGDHIVAVDGTPVGKDLDDAVRRIRGKPDTSVTLTIVRGDGEPFEVTIPRKVVETPTVESALLDYRGKRFLHTTIAHFDDRADALFGEAIGSELASNADALILDLRYNPGGRLDGAVTIACAWLAEDAIVAVSKHRGGKAETYRCEEDGPLRGVPTIILVNEGSASASEILAGALQDHGVARVIGTKTYGKGSGQLVYDLESGAELRVTNFLWYTPKGRTIEKNGIVPDEPVEPDPEHGKTMTHDLQMLHALERMREMTR